MSIKSKADWLKGFLESLEFSESISIRQIQILKEKLNDLLEEIEEEYSEEEEDDPSSFVSKDLSDSPIDDDLPF